MNDFDPNRSDRYRRPVTDANRPEFRETLAATAPSRTYRSQPVEVTEPTSFMEQLVRFVAVLLSTFLAIRFIINLFSYDRSSGLVNFFYVTTEWMVAPFQLIFRQTPTGSGGYFDWAALTALVVLSIVASTLIRLLRPRV